MTLPLTIPGPDTAELAALPYDVRRSVGLRLELCTLLHDSTTRVATAQLQAATLQHMRGYSAKRILAIYYAYRNSGGDWRILVDGTKAPEYAERAVGLPYEFKGWVRDFLGLHQRQKIKPRYRRLIERLHAWRVTGRKEHAIPGYDFPPENAPGQRHPAGWSFSRLCRLKPSRFERTALAIGRQAARAHLPQVWTTRVGLKVGQIFAFDDQVHDLRVNFLGNRRAQRPLEFSCLDVFSGCFVSHGFKPTTLNGDERVMLRAEDFTWFAMHWLLNIGWRSDTGTQLVAEHGTAKFPEWLREGISRLTGDRVTFLAGGVDRRPALDGLFDGPARGNFKIKAALESMFNLVRNETAHMEIPGQVGKDRLHAPEEWESRLSHNSQMISARDLISSTHGEAMAGELRLDYLEWNQFVTLALAIYDRIDRRTEHALEGWVESGLVVADAILGRPRRLSPREVWTSGARELERAPGHWLPLLLPPEMGIERAVNERRLFEFQDQTIGPSPLRYLAQIDGALLEPGEKFLTYVNPWDPSTLYLTDAAGRYVGSCDKWNVPCKADTEAIHRQIGAARKIESALLVPVARAGLELSRARLDDLQHNAAVLDRARDGLTKQERTERNREQADLAQMAEEALLRNAE